MAKRKVLVIGSNATQIDVKGGEWRPTGQYLNETVVPAMALEAAGYELVLATPDGTKPQIDPVSDSAEHFGGDEAAYRAARTYFDTAPAMTAPRRLSDVIADGLDDYAGVFVPGGHAPVVDLMQDPDVGTVLRHAHAEGKPTALLCHGPAALAAAVDDPRAFRAALVAGDAAGAKAQAGEWPYRDYRMTVFSASEEAVAQKQILHAELHFDMPSALRAAGGIVETGTRDFAPRVIVDRELITGQNPQSDHALADALVTALNARRTG